MNQHDVQHVLIDQVIDPGKRVTVSMGTDRNLDSGIRTGLKILRNDEAFYFYFLYF